MPTYSNAAIDAIAAAVPGPYGPLTRVKDMDTLPTPHDRQQIEFTTNLDSNTVFLYYHELNDADRVQEALNNAYGYKFLMHEFLTELTAILAAYPVAGDGDYTYANYLAMVERAQQLNLIRNYL